MEAKRKEVIDLYVNVLNLIDEDKINEALEEWNKVPTDPVNYKNHYILCFLINTYVEYPSISYEVFKKTAHILVSKEYPFQIYIFDHEIEYDEYDVITNVITDGYSVLNLFESHWKNGYFYSLQNKDWDFVNRKQMIRRLRVIIWFVSEPAFVDNLKKEPMGFFSDLIYWVFDSIPGQFVDEEELNEDFLEKIKDLMSIIFLNARTLNPSLTERSFFYELENKIDNSSFSGRREELMMMMKLLAKNLFLKGNASKAFSRKKDLAFLMQSEFPELPLKVDSAKDVKEEEKAAREYDKFMDRLQLGEIKKETYKEREKAREEKKREERKREIEMRYNEYLEKGNKIKQEMLASLPAPTSSSSSFSSSSSYPRVGEKRPREEGVIDKMFFYFC